MPGGPVWKARTSNLGASIERCKNQVDRLEKLNNVDNFSKEVFKNANTRVEVCIKTRAPSADPKKSSKDWSSLMSDDTALSDFKPIRQKTTRAISGKSIANQRRSKDMKHYSKPTKSSLAARKSPSQKTLARPYTATDEPDTCQSVGPQLQFPLRTVKILLKEMKWSIKNDVASAERVLDDLEFVVDNVDLTKGQEKVNTFKEGKEDTFSDRKIDQKSQIFELTLLRSENNRLINENKELKRSLGESAHTVSNLKKEIADRDTKINDFKLIIASLTSNNNDMLNILSTKSATEDEYQQLVDKNNKLYKELNLQKSLNNQLESLLTKNQSEISRMQRIIGDLKSSLNRNIGCQDRSVHLNLVDSTIEFDMSSELKSFDGNDDNDSAIGDGISESLPLASANNFPSNFDNKPAGSPANNEDSNLGYKHSKTFQSPKSQSAVDTHKDPKITGNDSESEASFHPLPLEISETGSSDDQLQELSGKVKGPKMTTNDEERKALIEKASQKIDAKVHSFLEKLRNDKKFQVSFSSDMVKQKDAFSTIGDFTGLTSDVDSTQLTESKFKLGLDDPPETFDLSDSVQFNQ